MVSFVVIAGGSRFLIPLAVIAFFLIGVVFIFKKVFSFLDRFQKGSNQHSSGVAEMSRLNNERHGCKCYMDGLSDGEQEIAHILSSGLGYKDYFIFNNLTIPSDVNGSSQIDHLVVSKFGIFVIESKDYKGWIFGSKDQEHWTQSLPGGRSKFQFQNPLRQNWSHIMALKKLMPFVPDDVFKNIVVFSNSSEMKTGSIEGVVRPGALVRYISSFTEGKISEENLQLAIGKLSYTCQVADISLEQHINNLQSNHTSL